MGNVPMAPYLATVIPAIAAGIVKEKQIPFRRLLAAFFYGAILWGLASWRTDVATAFGWVGAMTSILINGDVVLKAIVRSV